MVVPEQPHAPADVGELTQIVQTAIADRKALQVTGGDTKRGMGFPARTTLAVSTTKFARIIDYDPSELVLTTCAGVKLSEIQTLLASHDQMLAFEPWDFASISGVGATTIGGVVAAGFAGSRRISAGNVRDHVLGFTAVSGRGEAFVAGGRVVKNVTGYDLSKLMCGSWGQLAILTELTLKVLPRPRASTTLLVRGLDDARAFAVMMGALRSAADVSGAAYVPQGTAESESQTLLRIEGFGPSIEARARLLVDMIDRPVEHLEPSSAAYSWSSIGSGSLVGSDVDHVLWRICVPATQGATLCTELRALGASVCVDWGGALIWAALNADVPADHVRACAERADGHATLMRAPVEFRSRTPALHPESAGVAALTQRVKAAFDPSGILDPLRFEVPRA